MISRRTLLGAGTTALGVSVLRPGAVLASDRRAPWGRLRRHLRGDLVLPSDAAYATAKQLHMMQYDAINPKAIAYCESARDIAVALNFAQDHDLPIAPRSGGHSMLGFSTTTGLVIDVSRLNGVRLRHGDSVRLGPGAQGIDILTRLSPHGLVYSGGSSPTVAVGGFLAGGGIGLLTRHIGIASDRVTGARVVLANGRQVRASPHCHSDLFWALRGGGGGNFGIVTEYELRADRLTTVATDNLGYGYDDALDMLEGYSRWLPDAPRTVGAVVRVALPDASPGVAPMCQILLMSTAGSVEEVDREAARLVSLTGPPAQRTGSRVMPYRDLSMNLYGCSALTEEQCRQVGTGPEARLPRAPFLRERARLFTDPVPRDGWARILAAVEAHRMPGQTHLMTSILLGGAANDLAPDATAYVHRDTEFLVNFSGRVLRAPATEEERANVESWVNGGFDAMDPYSNGETMQNFLDPMLPDWRRAYYGANYPRLSRVKRRYDPHGVFTNPQSIT